MIFDMFEYYNMLQKYSVNIIYSGPVWADGVEEIGSTLRKRLELDEMPLTASQSVFSVFIEQMNNMLMYSTDKQQFESPEGAAMSVSSGAFLLGVQGKTYFLQSGNMMKADSADMLRERIDYLNTLDKPQLRQYYKEQIKSENQNPHSKGAGLGIIEIARRATAPIEYKFSPIDADRMFFTMYVQIG